MGERTRVLRRAGATVYRLSFEPDSILLQGRRGRWRWPWAIASMAVAALVLWLIWVGLIAAFYHRADVREALAHVTDWYLWPFRPAAFFLWLAIFAPMALVVLFVLRFMHGLRVCDAFSYGQGFAVGELTRAASASFMATALVVGVAFYFDPQNFRLIRPAPSVLHWYFLAFGVILVQALAHEILVRGYLFRIWAAIFPFRLPVIAAAIILLSVASLPDDPWPGQTLIVLVHSIGIQAISFALLFRTRNLAASIGLHWMNNVIAITLYNDARLADQMQIVIYVGGGRIGPIVGLLANLGLLLLLLFWRRSPFYLRKANPT